MTMNLTEKIISIYPELADYNWVNAMMKDIIILRDDATGEGEYIGTWNHPTLAQPTQEQLDAAEAD